MSTQHEMWAEKKELRGSLLGRVPPEHQQRLKESRVKTNLDRTVALSVFIIGIQIMLNLFNILRPGDNTGDQDIMKYVILSLITLLVGVIYFLLGKLVKSGRLDSPQVRAVLPYSLLYLYASIQMIFFSFNIRADTGSNSFIIALILLGLFLVTPPVQTILSMSFFFGVCLLLMYVHRGDGAAWNSMMMTDTWANLLVIFALIFYMSCLVYQMYLRQFLNRIRLEETNRQLETMARTDSLTGLLNRRGFFGKLDQDWQGYLQDGTMVAVCMLDIDHFKQFNDQQGHLMGDDCLRAVGQSIQKVFAQSEESLACRYGGEEFLAVYRAGSPEDALDLAQQLRDTVARGTQAYFGRELPHVTISGGLTVVHPGEKTDYDMLIRRADDALYEAKRNGRNQIHVSEIGPESKG